MKDILLLIDGDNVNFTYFQSVLKYLEESGEAIDSVHLFGKLSSKYIQDWKAFFSAWNFVERYPVCANHKNATDIQMISLIFKMYYEKKARNFFILSSDSDFSYLLDQLPEDVNVRVGYCDDKVSPAYIEFLTAREIQGINLDQLRGPLTDGIRKDIVNTVLQAYLEFKLSPEFFSYDTVLSWVRHRYGDVGLQSPEDIRRFCMDKKLVFDERGVQVRDLETILEN